MALVAIPAKARVASASVTMAVSSVFQPFGNSRSGSPTSSSNG